MNKIVFALCAAVALSACEKVPAGNVAIKVNMYGDNKGVDENIMPPGRYWWSPSYEWFKYPTATQNVTWENTDAEGERGQISFQTRDGLTTTVNMGLKYHLEPSMIPQIFQTYRKGIDEITDVDIRNTVRNSMNRVASRYYIRDIYGEKKTEFLDAVVAEVKAVTEPNGIIVEEIFVVGTFYLPDEVYASINATQRAEQDALTRNNEIESSIADAKKKIEEARGDAESVRLRAEAEANANREIAQSISPDLIDYYRVQSWNGQMPQVTGSEGLIIDLSD